MKYLFPALLSFALLACQNESSPSNDSTSNSDSTATAVSNELATVALTDVLPPLEYELHDVKSNQESEIVLNSGVRITIPKDAFVDEYGNPVGGSVTLKIGDMTSMAAILKSGIRMDATMENGEQGIFQTAGMISIDAEGLEIAPGKSIEIDFPAESADNNYPLWKLNEETNEWEKVAATTEVTRATPATLEKDTSATPQSNRNNTVLYFDEFGGPYTLTPSSWLSFEGWQAPTPVPYNVRDEYQINVNFARLRGSLPEFNDLRPLYFKATSPSSMHNSKTMPLTNVGIRRGNGNHYDLYSVLPNEDTIFIKVKWTYTPQQKDLVEDYLRTIETYTSLGDEFNEISKYVASEYPDSYDDVLFNQMRDELERKIEDSRSLSYKELSLSFLSSLANYRSYVKNWDDAQRERAEAAQYAEDRQNTANAVLQTLEESSEQFRSARIFAFGVYNCDRFFTDERNLFTLDFQSDNEPCDIYEFRLIDLENRSIFYYTPDYARKEDTYAMSKNKEYFVIGLSLTGDAYLGKINTSDFTQDGTNRINLESTKDKKAIESFLNDLR
ncbi:MAG: hypothetical protein HWE14_14810 [Flavobacteriia bacterium]|nr:hypothetical protein [Flavobacteriia bacterium]